MESWIHLKPNQRKLLLIMKKKMVFCLLAYPIDNVNDEWIKRKWKIQQNECHFHFNVIRFFSISFDLLQQKMSSCQWLWLWLSLNMDYDNFQDFDSILKSINQLILGAPWIIDFFLRYHWYLKWIGINRKKIIDNIVDITEIKASSSFFCR